MATWLWETIIYNVPWYVWLWIFGPILAAVAWYITRFVGWRNAIPIVGSAALAVGAVLIGLRGRQQGARDQQAKEQRNADTTLDKAHDARADARARDDNPDRLRDDDGFRRDD